MLSRRGVVLGLLGLALLVCLLPQASAVGLQSYSGTWTAERSDCWTLVTEDGEALTPIPAVGDPIIIYNGAEGAILGERSDVASECGDAEILISGWSSETSPSPPGPRSISSSQPSSSSPPSNLSSLWMVSTFGLLGLLAVLGLAVSTDEGARSAAARANPLSTLPMEEGRGTTRGAWQRGRIIGFVTANEGIHMSAVSSALKLGNHQVVHHLDILIEEGHLWKRRDGRRLRFYTMAVSSEQTVESLPTPLDPNEFGDIAIDVLRMLEMPSMRALSQRQLASILKITQQSVSHHLKSLERKGLITRERKGLRSTRMLTERGKTLIEKASDLDRPHHPHAL